MAGAVVSMWLGEENVHPGQRSEYQGRLANAGKAEFGDVLSWGGDGAVAFVDMRARLHVSEAGIDQAIVSKKICWQAIKGCPDLQCWLMREDHRPGRASWEAKTSVVENFKGAPGGRPGFWVARRSGGEPGSYLERRWSSPGPREDESEMADKAVSAPKRVGV